MSSMRCQRHLALFRKPYKSLATPPPPGMIQLGGFYLDSTKPDVIRHSAGRLYSKLLKNLSISYSPQIDVGTKHPKTLKES